jgi:hypothetical protein
MRSADLCLILDEMISASPRLRTILQLKMRSRSARASSTPLPLPRPADSGPRRGSRAARRPRTAGGGW